MILKRTREDRPPARGVPVTVVKFEPLVIDFALNPGQNSIFLDQNNAATALRGRL